MSDLIEHEHLNYRKLTWLDEEDYLVELEYFETEYTPEGEVFIHIDVYNFSHNILKKLRDEFEFIKELAKENGFDFVYAYNANIKFSKLFKGHESIGSADWQGKNIEVIRWAV